MNCKSCHKELPTKRIELGFAHCTDCSTIDAYGTVDITYHKTGNTVQHVDKDTARNINKRARRNTYGSNLGTIKSGGYEEFKRKIDVGCSTAFIGSKEMFERVGNDAMLKLDLLGLDKALDYVKRKYESLSINQQQYNKLVVTLTEFSKIS